MISSSGNWWIYGTAKQRHVNRRSIIGTAMFCQRTSGSRSLLVNGTTRGQSLWHFDLVNEIPQNLSRNGRNLELYERLVAGTRSIITIQVFVQWSQSKRSYEAHEWPNRWQNSLPNVSLSTRRGERFSAPLCMFSEADQHSILKDCNSRSNKICIISRSVSYFKSTDIFSYSCSSTWHLMIRRNISCHSKLFLVLFISIVTELHLPKRPNTVN